MNKDIKIYLDVSTLHAGIYAETRIIPGKGLINVSKYAKIREEKIYEEIKQLFDIISIAKENQFKFCANFETILELFGTITIGRRKSCFDNIKIEKISAPIEYSRMIGNLGVRPRDIQEDFLNRIEDKRFKELQKITGAYQGKKRTNRSQLLDAFHIWCAEHNQCDYFLTVDFKLIRVTTKQSKSKLKIKIVSPSGLMKRGQTPFRTGLTAIRLLPGFFGPTEK